MQNPKQKHRQKLYYSRETRYFVRKSENFDELQLLFSLINVYKSVFGIIYFVQILSYLQKLKRPGFYTLFFYIFLNKSRSKQNKKNPEHLL